MRTIQLTEQPARGISTAQSAGVEVHGYHKVGTLSELHKGSMSFP
eukprot:CAMPEP_0194510842 /NCGR_PEP_ID=MMETSP0253-20130528/42311_1 /TAXON_ID=2966 /ORGANISM="Noctiluca scintillans" /LENGTH=44 /DNA_ID= /DNA_START= /DNA_END= /DNA_ORIENTATION=